MVGIKDWILHKLTGEWAIDQGMASSTGLLDIRRLDWDNRVLSLVGLTPEHGRRLFPALVPPVKMIGGLRPKVTKATGLPYAHPHSLATG